MTFSRRQAARRAAGRRHRRPRRPGRRACARHPLARALRPGGARARRPAGGRARLPPPRRSTPSRSGAWPPSPSPTLRRAGRGARRRRGGRHARRCRAAGRCPASRSRRPASPSTATTPPRCGPHDPPVIARVHDGRTICDLRTVDPADDPVLAKALAGCSPSCCLMHVVATAGHVDHGKSTLVLALTGTDPDRFAEEKRRGLTIDLGFAWTTLPDRARASPSSTCPATSASSRTCSPASARSTPACSSWPPPRAGSRSPRSTCASSSCSACATGWSPSPRSAWSTTRSCELARLDVADHVAGTFLEAAEVVDGRRARRARARRAAGRPRPAARGHARRPPTAAGRACGSTGSFAAKGAGTVVTGTLAGGALAVDDDARGAARRRARSGCGPAEPAAEPHERIGPGQPGGRQPRPASTTARSTGATPSCGPASGDRPGGSTRRCRCSPRSTTRCPGGAPTSPTSAPASTPCKVRVLGAEAVPPGGRGLVRLHLPVPLPLLPGDRYVLRESGRAETVGGGEVLDVAPVRPASKARPDRSVDRVVAERGWVDVGRAGAPHRRAAAADARPLGGRPRRGRAPRRRRWRRSGGRGRAARPRRRPARRAGAGRAGARSTGVVVEAGRARRPAPTTPSPTTPTWPPWRRPASRRPPPDGRGPGRAARAGAAGPRGRARRRVLRAGSGRRPRRRWPPGCWPPSPRASPSPRCATPSAPPASRAAPRRQLDARGVTRRRGDLRIAGPRLPADRERHGSPAPASGVRVTDRCRARRSVTRSERSRRPRRGGQARPHRGERRQLAGRRRFGRPPSAASRPPGPGELGHVQSLVITSPKASGSASSHEWVPLTTRPSAPTADAQRLEATPSG